MWQIEYIQQNSSGDLGSVAYSFITITPRSNLLGSQLWVKKICLRIICIWWDYVH